MLGALTAALGLPSVIQDAKLHSSLHDFELAMDLHLNKRKQIIKFPLMSQCRNKSQR